MVGIGWVREFLGDIKKTLFGLMAIGRHCLTQDQLSLSLSQFSTPTAQAQIGVAKAYEIVLANTTNQHRWGQLVIDIFLKQDSTLMQRHMPEYMQGHMASFEKHIFVRSCQSQRVGIRYNWRERMSFELEGVVFPPDQFWYQPSRAYDATYWVKVKLVARSGEQLEELTLVQRLSA